MVGGEVEGANSSFRSFIELLLLFQIIVIQKEPDHPSFLIDIKSKGTFSSKKEPIGKVWYIALPASPMPLSSSNFFVTIQRVRGLPAINITENVHSNVS